MSDKGKLFELLNLPETATREEIDAAYEAQMERFSEDYYLGSPLWDMAARKREALQEAYSKLTGAEDGGCDSIEHDQAPQEALPPTYKNVRRLINAGKLNEAERLLTTLPESEADAESCYLRGVIAWKRGRLDEARKWTDKAVLMAPTNAEFQNAAEQLRRKPSLSVRRGIGKNSRFQEVCDEGCMECLCEGICEVIPDCC